MIATWRHYDWALGTAVFGWALHYAPFYLMKRQLFLHHYLPALYFSVVALCQGWDFLTTRSRFRDSPRRASQITVVFIGVTIAVFAMLSPLAYGGKWTKSLCEKAKVFNTWDFDCNIFYAEVPPLEMSLMKYEQYDKQKLTPIEQTSPAVSGVPPIDEPQPVHYQDDEEAVPAQPPTAEVGEQEVGPTSAKVTPRVSGGHMRYEEVVYKDEHGNIIPEEELKKLMEEQGENIEFKTVYETQTKVLRAGEEPPPGAKRIPYDPNRERHPQYPEGQNPETQEGEERKAYRTG